MVTDNNRSLERRYRSGIAGLYARLRSNYDTIYEKLGDEGIKLITEMSHRYGLEVVQRARKSVKGEDIGSVGGYLIRIFGNIGEAGEITEMNENRIVIKITRCPLNFDKPEMCLAHTTMEKTVVEELSPKLTYRIGKSIPAGDPYCEHIIETKTTPQI